MTLNHPYLKVMLLEFVEREFIAESAMYFDSELYSLASSAPGMRLT